MELNDFKDWLFDVLNEQDSDTIVDIETNDKLNTFQLSMVDGGRFEIECRNL
ncbi:MAG: hypothetical protein K2P65_09550 [Lachnospiraceae bacterium]|nr:hypothetical protein [Lachnospiraceae bacterium]